MDQFTCPDEVKAAIAATKLVMMTLQARIKELEKLTGENYMKLLHLERLLTRCESKLHWTENPDNVRNYLTVFCEGIHRCDTCHNKEIQQNLTNFPLFTMPRIIACQYEKHDHGRYANGDEFICVFRCIDGVTQQKILCPEHWNEIQNIGKK
jgi:hypothetical protein